MCMDIPFILDALLTSSTVEVQVRFSQSFCSEIFANFILSSKFEITAEFQSFRYKLTSI
jgi:hypothetical protein